MKSKLIDKSSTILLSLAVLFMGAVVAVATFFVMPAVYREWSIEYPQLASFKYPVLLGLTGTIIAFYVAFYQSLKLINYVDKGKAFSKLSVKCLNIIKLSALVIAAIYTIGSPVIYLMAQSEDAPGILVIALIFIFASFVIAVLAAILERLLKDAIAIKSENDLTV